MHKPIHLNNLSLSFPHKICFEGFSADIHFGDRIGIIGKNGSGKSTLLNIILGNVDPTGGTIKNPEDLSVGFVPQLIEISDFLSGGERFNKSLSLALRNDPNILLLDEPTNHLDLHNRQSFMHMLKRYKGTLIVVSHDTELLRTCVDTLWHINDEQVIVFSGNYDDLMQEMTSKKDSIENKLSNLNRQEKGIHQKLMKEQKRAAKSKTKGSKSIEQRKWPTIVSKAKASRSSSTAGKKQQAIASEKQHIQKELKNLNFPKTPTPKFSIDADQAHHGILVQINDGCVGYDQDCALLKHINLIISGQDRIAICGDNGSGKSTLIKAILEDQTVLKSGYWIVPKKSDIGYLDQHYKTLDPEKSVFETISALVPEWSNANVRSHLNDFLFRKNEEVNALTQTLSGGEKARLSLAQIAAKTPRLLVLDEITNNLDIGTKEYIIQILKSYPGALIVISHEEDFLKAIGIGAENTYYLD
jgi:ATPase subunit of ABC transporter with duplicated ATPase domains